MDFDLPGFRFHPTEEELLDFYLRRAVRGKKLQFDIIATVHLYRHDPSQLPEMARMGETEWYFFVPRDRKHGTGGRLNRTTKTGFWKSSGFDRQIRSVSDPKRLMGLKKTLVYYEGRAPRGIKTDWVMNEYRMPDDFYVKEDVVLCKVYKKATPLKVLEQRASMEENRPKINLTSASLINSLTYETHITESNKSDEIFREKEEKEVSVEQEVKQDVLPELQFSSPGLEWLQQDPYFNQLRSLWLR